MKTAVIAGAVALAAIVCAVIIVVGSSASHGLYISAVSGNVSVSNSNGGASAAAAADMKLSQGDIVTVSEDGSCTLIYRTGKNKDTNYMVLLPKSQVFVTDSFSGKEDSELYLNRGTVISKNSEDLGASSDIRTSNMKASSKCAVSVISYVTDAENTYTEISSVGGNVYIQLYDERGDEVNKSEPLGPARKARVVSGEEGPYFAYLNEHLDLSDFDSHELRELFAISSYVKLEFSSEEIKAAYDAIPSEEKISEPMDLNEVTTPAISEASAIQTAHTIATDELGFETDETTIITSETAVTESDTSETATTTATASSAAEETAETEALSETAEDTETETADTVYNDDEEFMDDKYIVYVVVEGEITEQEVAYGKDAVQPADPVIEGKKFVGWDGSFLNITSDTTISAIFEDENISSESTYASSADGTHTVTVIIGSNVSAQTVNDGESAVIPAEVTVDGYIFKGWDTDFSCVKSDLTVTAVLEPVTCSVKFIVDGISYYTTVDYGGTAAAPVAPETNSAGQKFIGWDRSLSDITGDTVITAVFSSETAVKKYTVTFIVDGVSYTQTVEEGKPAIAPSAPAVNSEGKSFLGWDKDYSNITSDMTITAVYG